MGKDKKRKNVAGLLGYLGPSINEEYTKKSVVVNKLVSEYNRTVWTLPPNKQMKYQFKMKNKMNKILGYC